ncbi:lysylphosphatidylglycerol synthase domain-containing protein [Sediminibacterium sp.]|uniref:lysylphosphatidylglycerol synthase domain-containing protein n=1 Tax=Sediminibacterium sp. TaxID=1917865 RepID=UPI002724603E|nr:lysylphosphatidylglycerol synthase domain-containing protein [Sediminibacterium sp.]MDO8997858.1 lysylphosphatidylglycerol synthase domain-containing protein [Sediminibacterium sp.]MDP2422695.1 lysylphosphatidylglycerol synthase domain-containing protein [Sediminibacterium sp.]
MINQLQPYLYKKLRLTKGAKNFLNYIVGPLLFLWLAWSIYQQVQNQSDLTQSWKFIQSALYGPSSYKIAIVGILMLINLGLEAKKWQLQVGGIEQLGFFQSYRAVLAGQAMGLNTINRIGEPAARAAFLQEGNKIRGVMLSLVGGMAQTIATFGMGTIFLLYMRFQILDEQRQIAGLSIFWLDGLIYVITMGISLFTLAYFRISVLIQLIERIPFVHKYKFFLEKLEDFHWKELVQLLLLSLLRYLVVLTQYYFLMQVFDVNIFWVDAFSLVGVMFLVLGIVPSIAFVELGFRGKVSVLLLGMMSTNTVGIIATIAGIWLINLILPAIAGTLFILGVRIFRNK